MITSHVVYKLKSEEDGSRKMKARIVLHGNYDDDKESQRSDSSNAPLFVVRMLLSLVTFMGFRLGTAHFKGAYLQSGPITRDIYLPPPRDWCSLMGLCRGLLWKLLKLSYGIVEAGRQWQKVVEQWMLSEGGLERLFGMSQLYVKCTHDKKICLIVAKVTDDFLPGGSVEAIKEFIEILGKRFMLGKTVIDERLYFDGGEISQDAQGSVTFSMLRYMDRLKPLSISRT